MIKTNRYWCNACGKGYDYNKNLRQHVSKAHPEKLDEIAPCLKKTLAHQCKLCDRQFTHKYNLKRHERQYHNIDTNKKNRVTTSFDTLTPELMEFPSFASFIEWKQELEKETYSKYVKKRGTHAAVDKSKRHYYICHRSGVFVSEGMGIRRLKRKGSIKINAVCPASIQVTQYDNGTCKVKYISTHIGHTNDLMTSTSPKTNSNDCDNLILGVEEPPVPREKAINDNNSHFLMVDEDPVDIEKPINGNANNYLMVDFEEDPITHEEPINDDSEDVDFEEDSIALEEEEILAQTSKRKLPENQLQSEKQKLKDELMSLVDGISTSTELNVLKRHATFMNAAIDALRCQS